MLTLEGPSEDITWVRWHGKGDVLLAGSSDMSLWLWSVPSGACMAVLSGHGGAVACGGFTPDGRYAVSAAQDGAARLWSPKDGACRAERSDPKGAGPVPQARRPAPPPRRLAGGGDALSAPLSVLVSVFYPHPSLAPRIPHPCFPPPRPTWPLNAIGLLSV